MPTLAETIGAVPVEDDFPSQIGAVPVEEHPFGAVPVEESESDSTRAVIPFPNERQPKTQTGPTNALELEERNIRERQQQTFDIAREQERANFTPEQIRRLDTGSVAENLMTAPPGIEAPMVTGEQVMQKFPKLSPTTAKAMAGLLQTGAGAWNFMASPVGAATLPVAAMAGAPGLVGLAGKSVLGTFGLEAFAAAPEAIEQFDTAMRSGDPEKIAQTASQLGLIFAVATGATKGTVESVKGIPRQEASAIASKARESGLSQSAAALEGVAGLSVTPEGAQMGIRPPGSEYVDSLIKFFTPPEPTAPVEVQIQPGARIPRLQPYEAEKSLASSPHGLARIPGFGRLADPRARVESPVDSAIITRAYSVSKGKTFAALWGQSQHRSKELFKADADTGTIPLTNGERGYISDVIESEIRDPGSQKITDAQRQWITDEWLPVLEDVRSMLKEEGVTKVQTEDLDFDVANDYFPRPAIGKRNRKATPSGQTGGRPGADPFFEKSRKYKTEFEGARRSVGEELKEEIIYDPDAISRATKFITGAYRAVADHRLANDTSLGGQTVMERFDVLKSNDAARLDALPDDARVEAESQLREQAAYPIWGKEEQLHIAPAFTGKIYPIETSSKLRTAYTQEAAGWIKNTSAVTAAAKAMAATLDTSAPWIQGAAMMGRYPIRWAKSTWNSYRALVDPNVVGKMLEQPKYRQAAEEFSQSGGTLLQLEDFLSGMGEGTFISKIPVYGKAVQASGRSYGAFMDLAKLELWDAWRDATPREQWGKLAEDVENALFMGRMEKIGLNPGQSVAERLMLFAPIYYRGAGGMITSAMSRGLSGKRMRQMIGGYAAAGALVTVAAWNALGLSKEEQMKRIDPRNGTFMKVPIPTGDGKRIEVGIGNVLSQLVRLAGRAFDYHAKDKEIDTGIENNPYLQFLSARAAFIPSLAVEIVMGQDYRGNPLTIKEAVVRKFIPFAFQSMFPNEEVPTSQRMLDAAFSAFGLNAFPESEYAAQLRHMDDLAKKEKGKPFLELPIVDRALAVKSFKESPDFKKRDPSVQDMRRFLKINEDREASLKKRIVPEIRTKLDELGLSIGGYKSTITLQGIDIPLSHKEQERYEELLAEAYNEHAAKLPEEVATVASPKRDKWWSNYQEEIRKTARAKLIVELNKK